MNEPIKWQNLSAEQRDALVAEKLVMLPRTYSTSMDAAWLVVERFNNAITNIIRASYDTRTYYCCEITFAGNRTVSSPHAATPMEAICLAALGVVGVRVEAEGGWVRDS